MLPEVGFRGFRMPTTEGQDQGQTSGGTSVIAAARLPRAALPAAIAALIAFGFSDASAKVWQVTLAGISFTPQALTIDVGDTVRWFNSGGTHTTTSGTSCTTDGVWDSGIMTSGTAFIFQFMADGTYPYFCIPHCGLGMTGTITVDPATGIRNLPAPRFSLNQNHPNPFNPSTRIEYSIEQSALVRVDVFDSAGRRVKTLINETRGPGPGSIEWNGTSFDGSFQATGVYYYRLLLNGLGVETRKMVLLK